jgi:hypothetical protein|eukprot:COSAG01_NODE_6876_length_3457_cov_77.637284_1_plen_90_part_00
MWRFLANLLHQSLHLVDQLEPFSFVLGDQPEPFSLVLGLLGVQSLQQAATLPRLCTKSRHAAVQARTYLRLNRAMRACTTACDWRGVRR